MYEEEEEWHFTAEAAESLSEIGRKVFAKRTPPFSLPLSLSSHSNFQKETNFTWCNPQSKGFDVTGDIAHESFSEKNKYSVTGQEQDVAQDNERN